MILRFTAAATAAALFAYLPFLGLPFISDDYTQIRVARAYGPPSGWGELAADPLYRCRATSLLLTAAVDSMFGLSPLAHNFTGHSLHVLNTLLVGALGLWRRIGFAVSLPAALFFAVYEGHQEAVVWNAALPELLVFAFSALTLLAWVQWLQTGRDRYAWAAAAAYLFALYSKESAVVLLPFLALAWWIETPHRRAPLLLLACWTAVTIAYAAAIFSASASHLHLNDGTFSLSAPFPLTAGRSLMRMLWIWGVAALVVLAVRRRLQGTAALALGWVFAALLPYSFLSYMDRVPSRHTYLAAAGLALLVGAAWNALPVRRRLAGGLVCALLAHNVGYLWMRKLPQFERRAAATQRFLDFAADRQPPIVVDCAPYAPRILADAAAVALGLPLEAVLDAAAPGSLSSDARYCDLDHP